MAHDSRNGNVNDQPNGVTEDEAALYDRQIRLWGLEAQGRIRNAHILVINLDGLTTEAIKNWVLAGIHRLTLADVRETTAYHDLSAGFFWREEDVGQTRLQRASERIQALNPLVKIDVLSIRDTHDILQPSSSTSGSSQDRLAQLKPDVVVVGVPSGPLGLSKEWDSEALIKLNHRVRALNIPFYCAATQGLDGWFFSDLGDAHEYVLEKPELPDLPAPAPASTVAGEPSSTSAPPSVQASSSSAKRLEKRTQTFVPLDKALSITWNGLTRAQLRRVKLSLGFFGTLAAWNCCKATAERTPSAEELANEAKRIIHQRGLDVKALLAASVQRDADDTDKEDDYFQALATAFSLPGEFSPSCAMLGGVLAQDVLNAIGGRMPPIVNWFQLEGLTGAGLVFALSTPPSMSSITPATTTMTSAV